MTEHSHQTAPHRRTRLDHSTETAEDYVEAIAKIAATQEKCRVTDLARNFGVSHVTVNRILARLQSEGFVSTEPYRPVALTAKGQRLARESARRHDIVYRFLLSIGIDERTASIDAEGIEHHVSRKTLERFEQLAGPGTRTDADSAAS